MQGADERFTAIAERVAPGATILRRWPLKGGVSAQVEALELQVGDGIRRVVVRRHGAADWKPLEPNVAAVEFALLQKLGDLGFPVPQPLFLDDTGTVLPSPFFVMSFVEGTSENPPERLHTALEQLAVVLARLHAFDVDLLRVPDLPEREDPVAGALQYLPEAPRFDPVRAVLETLHGQRSPNAPAMLHGDVWLGNTLWNHGELVAMLDWEDAAVGDPLCDVAQCRVELLMRHGLGAMERFTTMYLEQADLDLQWLPVWELFVASAGLAYMHAWGLAPEVEAVWRSRARAFLEHAGRELQRHLG